MWFLHCIGVYRLVQLPPMMRSGIRCRLCCVLLVGACAVIIALLLRQALPVPQARGWCCMRATGTCAGGYDPGRCEDAGGFAYTRDEAVCTLICATSPQTNVGSPDQRS